MAPWQWYASTGLDGWPQPAYWYDGTCHFLSGSILHQPSWPTIQGKDSGRLVYFWARQISAVASGLGLHLTNIRRRTSLCSTTWFTTSPVNLHRICGLLSLTDQLAFIASTDCGYTQSQVRTRHIAAGISLFGCVVCKFHHPGGHGGIWLIHMCFAVFI